ncbi:AAA family ATPase [Paractinoplanes rishiriensis]|uniref:Kinase n=1 Tax=Paractinoplanes rishiriensis TaxID=1050105 RepID=A0A919JWP4_9ACTN|nr:AAA family ATPase [Actinoplanes rishiriensis]GIE94654.1 hypothetical protein Ari01nite_21190 [Actinoplanes rishiriensis]
MTDETKRRGRLVVLRGNSGSGKTTTARELRRRHPGRFVWIEQDNIRRTIIDEDGLAQRPLTVDMIECCARLALAGGRDVIVEGILDAARYGSMLHALHAEHPSVFCYFALTFDETARRHATRPLADAFGVQEMARWYRADDRLSDVPEVVIGAEQPLHETARRIQDDLTNLP